MKTRYLIALALGPAAVAVGLSCAPVDPAASDSGKGGQTTASPSVVPPGEVKPPLPDLFRQQVNPGPTQSDALKARIDAAISQVRRGELRTDNGFWTVFHGILGLGPSVELLNPETGEKVKALDYIAAGLPLRGLSFKPTPFGLDVETMPGSFVGQGHQDQFVAEMVEWGVKPEKKFVVNGKDYTFNDFIRHSKAHASAKTSQELEWAIVIIGTHYGTDAAWTNAAGEELREPWVQTAANALAMMFLENQDKGIDGGSMYHAVHGLLIYSARVYGADQLGPLAPHVPPPPAKKG